MDGSSPPFSLHNPLISIIMATALATTAAPVQFDFQNNNVEVMTLDTLRRTHKENDIFGKPVKGIYHYEVIERMAGICKKYNLNYEVEEIFAAQNKNKAQPGVVVLPQVEQEFGALAVEAHILRRVYTTIRIKNWETDELTHHAGRGIPPGRHTGCDRAVR